ncbi:MAG: DUF397 domain-containing protein [Trebonia sp.]
MDREASGWRKASYSNGQGNCVEVGHDVDMVAVRDTKDRDSGTLAFTVGGWGAFTASLK